MKLFLICALCAISLTEAKIGLNEETGIYEYVKHESLKTVQETRAQLAREARVGGDAHEEAVGGILDWLQDGWGHVVRGVDAMFEKTGLDTVVHWFTGGKRLFNPDGSYNNELMAHTLNNVRWEIGSRVSKTALGRILNAVSNQPFDADGSLKAEFDRDGSAREMNDVLRDFGSAAEDKAEEIWNDIKDGWTAVTEMVNEPWFTDDDRDFFWDVLHGRRNLDNQADLNRLQELMGDKLQKITEKVRYRLGLVDLDPPNIMFGTGISASAAWVVQASVALTGHVSFPLSRNTGLDFAVAGTVGLGVGVIFGGDAGWPLIFSFNTPASGVGGFGLTVSFDFAAGGGGTCDIGFALDTDAKQLKLSTITITPTVGAKAGVAVQASYTNVIWSHMIKINPVDPAEIGVDPESVRHFDADWFTCSEEGQDCYCNGNVRYGSGDNWYMRTDNVDRIRCSRSSFGNNYVANAHCECLTDQCIRPHEGKRYEIDCGFWWWDTCGDGCRAYGGCRGACCKVQQDYCEGDNSCLSDRSCRGAETEEALALPIKNLDTMESANALSPKSTSFSFGDATYFLAGIGFAAALYGVAKYSKPSKYQEIESEI